MASPCEVLVEAADRSLAQHLSDLARTEALRIEHKFSRYRSDSVVAQMHAARGQPLAVDDETAHWLDFAAQCHALSGGLFDITSGVLRRAWRFDAGATLPDAKLVAELQSHVGWSRVLWQRPLLTLPADMEIDFGGIGKEYAVDRVLDLLKQHTGQPLLVNFGGDLAVSGPRSDGTPWIVGIERPNQSNDLLATTGQEAAARNGPANAMQAAGVVQLSAGALATSGDARRFLLVDGVRFGHILDPRTGWPVQGAPRSVTVAAPTCVEAGMLATMSMLQGPHAEAWLAAQGVPHWVLRESPTPHHASST